MLNLAVSTRISSTENLKLMMLNLAASTKNSCTENVRFKTTRVKRVHKLWSSSPSSCSKCFVEPSFGSPVMHCHAQAVCHVLCPPSWSCWLISCRFLSTIMLVDLSSCSISTIMLVDNLSHSISTIILVDPCHFSQKPYTQCLLSEPQYSLNHNTL